ncbi:hypothetical protein ACFVYR_12650 [Streptomyces sp. NPDC058284]
MSSVDGGFRMSARTPERAALLISLRRGSPGSVVWPKGAGRGGPR